MGAVSPPGGDFSDPVTAQTLNIVQVSSSGGGGGGRNLCLGGVGWYVLGGSGVVCAWGEWGGMWEGSGVVCVWGEWGGMCGGLWGVVHMCGRGVFHDVKYGRTSF